MALGRQVETWAGESLERSLQEADGHRLAGAAVSGSGAATSSSEHTPADRDSEIAPLDQLHFHGAGWQAHLEDLRRSLAGEPSTWKTRWTELTPASKTMPIT